MVLGKGAQNQRGMFRKLWKKGNGTNKGAEAQGLIAVQLLLWPVWPIVFMLTVSQVYLFRVMIMLTSPPFLPLKQGVKTLSSIMNDPGSERHPTLLYHVNTWIQPFIVSVRRKQIDLRLKVWEMSALSCLIFLAVVSIWITSFSPWSRAWYLFPPHLSAAQCVRQLFTVTQRHNRAQAGKVAAKSVCHSWWLCSQASRKPSAAELNYGL